MDTSDKNLSHIALNDCPSNAEEKEEAESRAEEQELRGKVNRGGGGEEHSSVDGILAAGPDGQHPQN